MAVDNAERELNQAAFARLAGVKPQAITKAINSGKLIKHGKGHAARIRLDDPLTQSYLNGDREQRKGPRKGKRTVAPTTPAPPEPIAEEKNIPPASPENMDKVEAYIDNQALKRLKLEQEHEKLRLGNREKRGELIKRETVQAFMHRLHEIDGGQWKTLGLKISSDIAAAMGFDDDGVVRKVCDVVDREVLAVMKQIKREQNKFLKKIGAEKLPKEGKAA
jgi:hypothetical protein